MKFEHLGLEVGDLYAMELFYRRVLGFTPRYRYVSRNTPGLRTVFLERGELALELLERRGEPAPEGPGPRCAHHLALAVDDVDAWHARLAQMGLADGQLGGPRTTGDGYRELTLRDPEGNQLELTARLLPPPWQPVRAVIFDLDGTLIDSEENSFQSDVQLLGSYGVPFSREDKHPYIGGSNRDMMVDWVRRYRLAVTPDELLRRKNALYLERAEASTPVIQGMLRFLQRVKARGLPVAVASGSSPDVIGRLLAATGLAPLFPVTVSADEVPFGKPRPDVFEEAARRLGVPAEACLVVEDAAAGVEAARRAFMRCLAVPFMAGGTLPDAYHLADLLFEGGTATFDPDEAWRWLEGLL